MTTTTTITGTATKQVAFTAEFMSYHCVFYFAKFFDFFSDIKPNLTSGVCINRERELRKFAGFHVGHRSHKHNFELHHVYQKVIDGLNEFFTYIVREPQSDNEITKINRTQ